MPISSMLKPSKNTSESTCRSVAEVIAETMIVPERLDTILAPSEIRPLLDNEV